MTGFGRRTLMRGGAGLAAAAALARPNIARAADKTLDFWWAQGFYPAEDQALRDVVASWEKQSGYKVNLSLVTGNALDQKIVSALTTGTVPDLVASSHSPTQTLPQAAWDGKLVDVTDVIETQKKEYLETALRSAQYYNNVIKKRSYYGVPTKAQALNMPTWKPLVEKAGFQMSDIPKTWDKFFAFFEPVQDRLRKQGMRHVYGLGYTLSTSGQDPNNLFNQALIAYGGGGVVTPDGQPHFDDPKVRKAMIDTINMLAVPYRKGYVPRSAINWADGDNNSAFHSRQVVMTPNDTISISTAIMKEHPDWYYHDIVTQPMPKDNAGNPVEVMLSCPQAFIMKGAKGIDGAKSFLRHLIQPHNLDSWLKQARARWLPVMPSIVKNDPYWTDSKDPHRLVAIKQGLGPSTPWRTAYNPGYAQADAEYVWTVAVADAIHGMKAEDAADKAFKHLKTIFAKYQIG